MPEFSVIVPVYNAEEYLHRCIDSVLSQSFNDFEVILIDDGSADNSGVVCDEYAARDGRVKVIHQANNGVSSARNNGLKVASGNRVIFVDADDYIFSDYLQTVNDIDADLVMISFETNGDEGTIIEINQDYHIDDNKELISIIKNHFILTVWAKVYAMSIIRKKKIAFDESLNYGEDTLFTNTYIKQIKTASSTSYIGYYHTVYSSTTLSQYRLNKPLTERIDYLNKLICLWESDSDIQAFWSSRFLWNAENEFRRIANSNLNSSEKKIAAKKLINHDVFKQSLKQNPEYFARIVSILIKFKCYSCILHKYKQ